MLTRASWHSPPNLLNFLGYFLEANPNSDPRYLSSKKNPRCFFLVKALVNLVITINLVLS